jgi:hypothetical protein
LRSGPLEHRSANSSRVAHGSSSTFLRAASPPNFYCCHSDPKRILNLRPETSERKVWEAATLKLDSWLPINLRQFLSEHLGPHIRVEDDAIVALVPRSGEWLIGEVARTIRRFSTERVHEAWNQCALPLNELEGAQHRGSQREIVVCLRCVRVETCADALGRHRDDGCLAVSLPLAETSPDAWLGAAQDYPAESVHRAIEGFRNERIASGLPHFDLDCYVANGRVVITWRPMPAQPGMQLH